MLCCSVNALRNYVSSVFIFPRVNVKTEMLLRAPPGSLELANSSGWMKFDRISCCVGSLYTRRIM